jgi:hypothetical protein
MGGLVASLLHWNLHDFSELDPRRSLRIVVPSATALVMSMQTIFASLFASVLGIRRVRVGDEGAPAPPSAAAAVGEVSRPGEVPAR